LKVRVFLIFKGKKGGNKSPFYRAWGFLSMMFIIQYMVSDNDSQ